MLLIIIYKTVKTATSFNNYCSLAMQFYFDLFLCVYVCELACFTQFLTADAETSPLAVKARAL